MEPTAVDDDERGAVKDTAAVDANKTDGLCNTDGFCRPTTAPWPP